MLLFTHFCVSLNLRFFKMNKFLILAYKLTYYNYKFVRLYNFEKMINTLHTYTYRDMKSRKAN